jgi:hypothetical protein
MRGKNQIIYVLSLMVVLMFGSSAQAVQWRFPVGIAYSGGFHDVVGVFKDNLRALNYTVDGDSEIPVGLTFQPYYQFDNGLGIGGGFGPFMYLRAEASSGDSYSMYTMPINLCLRYAILPSSKISPYLRAGVSYNIAGGDFVQGKDVGFLGGIGVEFFRQNKVGFGLEVTYDSSELKLEKKLSPFSSTSTKVKPSELLVSIFAVF